LEFGGAETPEEPDPLRLEEPLPGDEIPLVTRIVENPDRRGYDSAFIADWWGDTPKLRKYPRRPDKPFVGAAWDRWGRQLIAAIKARTAPPLLRLDEALAALDLKRRPKWLPAGRQDGEEWVEQEVVRARLLLGLPHAESTAVIVVWPIKVPRCRYCGRLSIYGWADMVCERCKKMRIQIENRGITGKKRRGWTGPPTIGDDELLLDIQRRLWGQDHRALKEQQKASGVWAKRVAEAREHDAAVAEEPEFADAAE
jgi:hypothetical protein